MLVLGALVAGMLVAAGPPVVALVLAGLVATAGGPVLRRPLFALVLGAGVLAGALGAHARLAALDRTALTPLIDRVVSVRATLLEAPRDRRYGSWTAPARVVAGPGRGERIVLRGRGGPRGEIGAEVEARGRIERLAPWEAYEARRGAHAALTTTAVRLTGRRRGGLAGAVDTIRRTAERGVSAGLPPPQAALARGMVLGQDDALDEDTREAFRASGLSHVLAASGQNVALLAVLAAAVVMALAGGLRMRLAAALALVALYVPLAGAGPSIQRAGVMGAAALVAGLAGRPASRAYALVLAAAVTLALNPRAAGDPGWQLSFAAVVAIAVLVPRLRGGAPLRGLPAPVADGAAMTLAATLGTAPLLALHFERLSLASLPANLVAMPAVAPVVWLGTLSGALAQLGAPGLALAGAVNDLAALPLGFVDAVATTAARLPHASVPLRLGVPAAIGAYLLLAAATASRRVRVVVAGAAVPLVLARGRSPSPPAHPRRRSSRRVSFLDIGQGDATLLQDGDAAVLVDTGPPDGPIVERLRAAGVRHLEPARAHARRGRPRRRRGAGAAGRAGGRGARRSATAPAGGQAAMRGRDRSQRARRVRPVAGQRLRVGALDLRVLWPPPEPPTARRAAQRPGDRPARPARPGEPAADRRRRVATSTAPLDLPPVDVLKVAHHGVGRSRPAGAARRACARRSRRSRSAPTTPTATRPPRRSRALRAARVPRVLRTDRDGTVRLTLSGGEIRISTQRGP